MRHDRILPMDAPEEPRRPAAIHPMECDPVVPARTWRASIAAGAIFWGAIALLATGAWPW